MGLCILRPGHFTNVGTGNGDKWYRNTLMNVRTLVCCGFVPLFYTSFWNLLICIVSPDIAFIYENPFSG